MGVASSLSTVVGPLLGVSIYNIGGLNYVLWSCIGLGLAGFILNIQVSEKKRIFGNIIEPKEYIKILKNRNVMVASGLVLVLALMNGGIFSFLPILVKAQFKINVGLIFMIIATSLIISRLFTSQLSDRYGRGPCAFYSFLILCLSYYLIGQSQTEWELIGAAILNGFGMGGCLPALTAFVDRTENQYRGIAFSIFYGAFDVGMLLGGAALGLLADITSLRDMYIITAMFGILVIFSFALSIQANPVKSIKWTLVGK